MSAQRLEQLDDNLAATALKLSDAEIEALDAVSALPAEYPGRMVDGWVARQRLPSAAITS